MIAEMMAIVPLRTWIFWVFIAIFAIASLGIIGYHSLRKDNKNLMAMIITLGRKNDTN